MTKIWILCIFFYLFDCRLEFTDLNCFFATLAYIFLAWPLSQERPHLIALLELSTFSADISFRHGKFCFPFTGLRNGMSLMYWSWRCYDVVTVKEIKMARYCSTYKRFSNSGRAHRIIFLYPEFNFSSISERISFWISRGVNCLGNFSKRDKNFSSFGLILKAWRF